MKSKWVLLTAGFLAGVAVGFLTMRVNHSPGDPAPQASATAETPPPGHHSPPAPDPAPPAREIAAVAPRPITSVGNRLNAVIELNTLLRSRISFPLFAGDNVNEDFAKVYGLTASDVAQLKASLSAAKKNIAELEAKYATIKPAGENACAISIPPFPQEGGVVYDRLLQSVQQILGEERFAAYRAMGSDVDSSTSRMFGLSDTTITLQFVREGEHPGAQSSSSFDANGPMKLQVDTNSGFFPEQYPELYRKMVAAGLWKGSPAN